MGKNFLAQRGIVMSIERVMFFVIIIGMGLQWYRIKKLEDEVKRLKGEE